MSLKDFIISALESGNAEAQIVNESLMEISKSNRKKPAFIKIAVDDDRAGSFMMGGKSAFGIILYIDRDEVEKFVTKEEST